MTFNRDADIGDGKVSKRGKATIAAGGGIGLIALLLVGQLLGVDLTGFIGGGDDGSTASTISLDKCQTGADANEDPECRVVGAAASLDDYWEGTAPDLGIDYRPPDDLVLFDEAVQTGCGSATSATGPFYCPLDERIYIDVSFYDALRERFGARGGPLAEMYIIAHEWGHHIQQVLGILESTRDGQTGPTSNAVRVELQADCFAGAWAGAASSTEDASGTPFLQPITDAQVRDALSAAAAVGDDRIQEEVRGEVDPHSFTHGTSEQRQRWFLTGFREGAAACDTFAVGGTEL